MTQKGKESLEMGNNKQNKKHQEKTTKEKECREKERTSKKGDTWSPTAIAEPQGERDVRT